MTIPNPKSPAEYLALLNLALTMATDLSRSLGISAAEEATTAQRLTQLTLSEKMELGDKASEELQSLAYAASPETVLDALDTHLAEHTPSQHESHALLERLRNQS